MACDRDLRDVMSSLSDRIAGAKRCARYHVRRGPLSMWKCPFLPEYSLRP